MYLDPKESFQYQMFYGFTSGEHLGRFVKDLLKLYGGGGGGGG